jgi:hypothetical protein
MRSMFTDELTAARVALEAVAYGIDARCPGRDAVRLVEQMGTIHRLADAITARAAKRIADTGAHVPLGDRSAAELCARLVGVRSADAKRAIDVAARLEVLPETEAGVRAGRVSAREAELISSVAVHDPSLETELLAAAGDGLRPLQTACVNARARIEDPDARSARQHAARSLQLWTNTDGMLEGHFRLTPEVGGRVKTAIEQHTKFVFRREWREGTRDRQDSYAADAFAELVTGGRGMHAGPKQVGGYTTHVVIDHEVLQRGRSLPGETCEIPGVGPVNARWVREILGESFVTAIIKHGRDITTVAHLGRHVPAELRTAMIVSGRECSIEGCHGREYLELDHCEVDHAEGGPTARWNLAWLCSVHHRRKTRGWRLGPPDPRSGKRQLDPPGASRAA